MNKTKLLAILAMAAIATLATPGRAATAAQIDRNVRIALNRLYATTPAAKAVGARAKAVLVFPSILKAGFVVGGQHGEGALRIGGRTAGYYRTVAASYGLQAGVQKFGYALFFMNNASLAYLDKSGGWELGVGPSIVVVDAGVAKSLSTTTLQRGVYAFFFDQRGLMAGLGLQGTKITAFKPGK